jgi:hypothetical protein
VLPEERRVEGEQVLEERVAQIDLDAAADAVEELALAIARGATEQCRQQQETRDPQDRTERHIRLTHEVDAAADKPRGGQRERARRDHEHHTPENALPVWLDERQQGAVLIHPESGMRVALWGARERARFDLETARRDPKLPAVTDRFKQRELGSALGVEAVNGPCTRG